VFFYPANLLNLMKIVVQDKKKMLPLQKNN